MRGNDGTELERVALKSNDLYYGDLRELLIGVSDDLLAD